MSHVNTCNETRLNYANPLRKIDRKPTHNHERFFRQLVKCWGGTEKVRAAKASIQPVIQNMLFRKKEQADIEKLTSKQCYSSTDHWAYPACSLEDIVLRPLEETSKYPATTSTYEHTLFDITPMLDSTSNSRAVVRQDHNNHQLGQKITDSRLAICKSNLTRILLRGLQQDLVIHQNFSLC